MRLAWRTVVMAALLCAGAGLHAQRGGSPSAPPPGGGMGPPMTPPGRPPGTPPPSISGSESTTSTLGPGLQLGPPGRWWDDRQFAKSLDLKPEQKTRMDVIFDRNRATIVSLYGAYTKQVEALRQATLQPKLDEATIMDAIDHLAQARAALEKADAHMLLQIRGEMTAEQIARLDSHR